MSYTEALCIACGEIIQNPICPECLGVEVEEWLEDKKRLPGLKKEIMSSIKNLVGRGKNIAGLRCITCSHESAFICPYCFTEKVYRKLKLKKAGSEILMSFLETFNFDFSHKGYNEELYEERQMFLEV